jgi:hypothetical protein
MNIRPIELMRAAWGAVLLVAPDVVLRLVHAVRIDRRALVVGRILGARQLIQASLSGINPSPEMLAAGAWVDAVHSMTAFGLAVVDRHRARVGVADGIVAGLWAALGLHHLYTGKAQSTTERGRDRLARVVVGALPGGRELMDQARAVRGDATARGTQ